MHINNVQQNTYGSLARRLFLTLFLAGVLFVLGTSSAHAAISYVGGNSATGNSAAFNVSLTALTGGSGSSAQQGDLVLVMSSFVSTANGNPGVGTAGYTEEQDLFADDTRDANMSVSWKFMTATPDTTVSCNGSGSATNGASCIVHVWRGVDSSTPLDVAETTATGINSAVPDPASITPSTSGAYVVIFGVGTGAATDTSVTVPTGYSNHVQSTVDPGNAIVAAVASKAWTSGAENPAAWTGWTTSTSDSWAAVTVALRPAPVVELSGTLYRDEGITTFPGTQTIGIAIGDGAVEYGTTTTSSGVWSYTAATTSIAAGTPIVIWVDGGIKATLITTHAGGSGTQSGLNLYQDRVIVRNESTGSVTLADLGAYDMMDDDDIQYVVDEDEGLLLIPEGQELYVWSGDTLTAATTTILGGGVKNAGTLDLTAGDTYLASDGAVQGDIDFNNVFVGTSTEVVLQGGERWAAQSASEANSWRDIAYGNGLFVAVADSGTNRVMTSPDGVTWTARSAAEANAWRGITFAEGLFVAIANTGTNRVMTSPDGVTWTARSAAEANAWRGITFAEGLFVAVSTDGTNRVMTSPDGITWTARSASEANSWRDIAYGNGTFVAVADSGTNRVMTSEDGITWTARSATEANTWSDIAYGNGLFVAIANTGTNRVMTSPDGITWTARSASEANSWTDIIYGNGLFVAVADSGTNRVMTSEDGITWTAHAAAEANTWGGMAYGHGKFVVVSTSGTNRVMTSVSGVDYTIDGTKNNGVTWTARSAAEANQWRRITYGNGLFVAVADSGTNRVMTSEDGITWTPRSAAEANSWRDVVYGEGLFVAVALNGTNRVMTSPDGITWTARSITSKQWHSVTYGNGIFVAVAPKNADGSATCATDCVATSPDGITWTAQTAAEANQWREVTFGNGIFVAVSEDGTNRVMTSTNGAVWTARAAAEANGWWDVAYGEGRFVAVAYTGTNRVMTSEDGITWTARSAAEANQWSGIVYGDGIFVAVSSTGTNRVMTSPDGITWTSRNATEANEWNRVAYGNGLFVAISSTGTNRVMTSSSTSEATPTVSFYTDTALVDLTIDDDATMVAPTSLTINGDYVNDGVFENNEGTVTVDVNTGTVGYDLAGATYDSVVKTDVGDTGPSGLHFRSDGLKMYTYGFNTDLVREFTLSSAWDLTTASQVGTYNASAQGSWSNDVTFNDTGTKMYLTGDDANAILEYALSTPWSVASGVTYTDSTSVSAKETSPFGVEFNDDGTLMYVTGDSSDAIHTYALSTAWDASSASFVRTYSVRTQESNVNGMHFSTDGTVLFVVGLANSSVYKYTLSTAWEVSSTSVSYTGDSLSMTPRSEAQPVQVAFKSDGTKMYVYGFDTNDIFQYTTGVEGTGTPDTDKIFSGNMTGSSAFHHLSITADDSEITFDDNAQTANLTIGATATVTAPTTLSVGGNFTNSGVFTAGAGTLHLNGTESTVSGTLTGDSALNNVIASSTTFAHDGITWTARTAAEANSWRSIAYGEGIFVAVANTGTNRVMTSPDGITWTARSAAEATTWQAVTYGNGLFVAVASTGTNRVMTSPDGITWTGRTAAEANAWFGVTYGEGLFVAIADSGTNRVMTSPDGITWTARSIEASGWAGITYGEGIFVAVGYTGTNLVSTSPDGITWTSQTAADVNSDWYSVTYGEGLFVAVANLGTVRAMTSPDGVTWTARTIEASDWYNVTYGNGLFVAVADVGTNQVATSPDGITWTSRSASASSDWSWVTFAEDTFVAVSESGLVMTSDTGSYDGGVTFSSNASTTDLTIGDGNTVTAPTLLSIGDDYTNDGTFTHNDGAVYFSGAVAQTLAGNMTGTNAFNDVTFSGASTKTFSNNASTSDVTIASGSTVVAPSQLTLSGSFTNNGTFTSGNGTLYIQESATEVTSYDDAYNVTEGVFDMSFSIASQELNPTGVAFSVDGTKMYVIGYDGDDVNQYALSVPWEISTASVSGTPFSASGQDGFFEDLHFSTDGTKMFLLGSGNDDVFSYTLSTAWDVTTATYDSASFAIAQDTEAFDMAFNPDGTKMFIMGDGNDRVYAYSLSTPWDITTVTYDSVSFLVSGQETSNEALAFSPDGTKMYVAGAAGDDVNPYTLSTPWLVSSATYDGASLLVSAKDTYPTGLWFDENGYRLFVIGQGSDSVHTYRLGIATTTLSGASNLSGNLTGTSDLNDVVIDAPQGLNPSGAVWTEQSAAQANPWNWVTYGEGLFVAVAYSGTNRVMTSPDGITWTVRTAPASSWYSVAYGNGEFVAVGYNAVMSSPDGITWTAHTPAAANEWNSVTFGNGTFVAVACGIGSGCNTTAGGSRVMTSTDGENWTGQTAAQANPWQTVTYGEGLFVAVSSSGTNKVMTSPDGVTWTVRTAAAGSAWYGLTYGNGLFVATAFDNVMTSPNGINWTSRTDYPAYAWQAVGYGGGMFVAVADSTAAFMTSVDGITWTERTQGEANSWWSVAYGNNRFVAVAKNGTDRVALSTSGDLYGTVTFEDNASTTDFTIMEESSVVAPAAFSIAGDYSNDGTINWGAGTTTFSGTSLQTATGTMTGISAFYDVRITNSAATTSFGSALEVQGSLIATSSAIIEFPAGATTTVAYFDVVGANGGEIVLRSTEPGTQWGLDATSHAVEFVDVQDSNACSGNGNITAYSTIDSGNNTCWDITPPAGDQTSISSAANQTFSIGQSATGISTITITEGETPYITAADDIRIRIDITQTDMRWNTADTSATIGGTASGKVSGTVSYEDGGTTVVIPVNSDFVEGDTITVSGLSFTDFGTITTAVSSLKLETSGALEEPAITWTARSASEANSWYSITYGEGLFVAVSSSGTNRVMTSPDGVTWTARSAAEANAWGSVTYGNGIFVAVAYTGTNRVMTSPDGITWTAESAVASNEWKSVTYGNGLFVAVADFNPAGSAVCSSNCIMTSPDGETWTGRSIPTSSHWKSVIYAEGIFVAVGTSGTHRVMTSVNGTTWTARNGVSSAWYSVTHGEGTFVAVAASGTNLVMTSPDGITWTGRTAAEANGWRSVTYGAGFFVAVSQSGTNRVMTSPDGVTWTSRSASEANSWFSVTYAGETFVAVAIDGTNRVMTSSLGFVGDSTATDDKTIVITGGLAVSNHDVGQVDNTFAYTNKTDEPIFAFKMVPNGENVTISNFALALSGVRRITSEKLSDIRLYRDMDNDGVLDGGDEQIGGAGALSVSGNYGAITFSTSFAATTSRNYLVTADITNIRPSEFMTISLIGSGITNTGDTTSVQITPSVSVSSVQHARGGALGGGGSSAPIGGEAPEGDGDVGGGGGGGGGGVGEEGEGDGGGETIGNEPGFAAPTATGSGFNEWTNGGNGYTSDGAYATAASTNLRQTYSIFGFNVPNGNTVEGIEVKLEASGSSAAGTIQVALSWNGGSSVTEVKATPVLSGSDIVYTLGGASDTWGRTWAPSEFTNENFFVRVIGQPNNNTVRVDAIQVRPYHQAGGGGGGGGGEI